MRRAILTTVLILALPPLAAIAGERDGPVPDRLPFLLQRMDGGWVSPDRLVVGGMAYALRGEPEVIGHDRVDLSGLPLVGGLVQGTIGPRDFTPEARVGEVIFSDGTIVLQLADRGLANLPVSVFADLPRHGRIEYRLDRRDPIGALAGIPQGTREGDVYLVAGRGGRRLVAVIGDIAPYLIE